MSQSPEPRSCRNRTDSNVIPLTFTFTCRTSARLGLFIRPPELSTTFWANQRCLVLLVEPLAGDFNDHTFGPQKIQLAPDVIDHQLPNCRVGQCGEPFLEQRSHAE